MSRHRTVTSLLLGLAGTLALAGCTGATLPAPVPPRLKVPGWARTAPPLTEQQAAQIIYDFGARRAGQVPLPRPPVELTVLPGSYTNPGAHEAVASFYSGLVGARAWQTWLLEWRDTGWFAVRPITSSCSGRAERAQLQRHGAHVLLVRESCSRFGREAGQVRLLSVGPRDDVELFAAAEGGGGDGSSAAARVRHTVWLTGFDAAGQAELVDLAFYEQQISPRVGATPTAMVTSHTTTYRPNGERLIALSPVIEDAAPTRVMTASW